MVNPAYYEADLATFLLATDHEVLGALAASHLFSLESQQRYAWQQQVEILRRSLRGYSSGQIYFEFAIPRVGKRADVVLLISGVVFVVEFKVGASTVTRSALEQVHDYALDLKNFHQGSHSVPIVPVALSTHAPEQAVQSLAWAADDVASPLHAAPGDLPNIIDAALLARSALPIDPLTWSRSGYQPTPTIIEAAQALYRDHDVSEIARSDAGAKNLGTTSNRINAIVQDAKTRNRKAICFVTGVPGAGKTLAGLNIATNSARLGSNDHAVFLSGNGPLVDVMREALARDQCSREGISKKAAERHVSAFIQNIHHFRDQALRETRAPDERVVIFDEAQRAWNKDQASKFMQRKRDHVDFNMSEPAFLVGVMDRHDGWCVIVCLVGGGQEINTGEAGLGEWLHVMGDRFQHWDVHVSSRLDDHDYVWGDQNRGQLTDVVITKDSELHLGVSMRSFRAESLSEFVGHVIENRPDLARSTYARIAQRYPIAVTRNLQAARNWLRFSARGTERYGLIASSGASRLRPEGIFMKASVDAPLWFLNDRSDVRSSYYLEEVASEFDVQGLELDWAGVCWDADYRYERGTWAHYNFRGSQWQRVNMTERRLFLKNAYRVILTRARQGMVIFVPHGSAADPTRDPALYDSTFEYLQLCGLPELA